MTFHQFELQHVTVNESASTHVRGVQYCFVSVSVVNGRKIAAMSDVSSGVQLLERMPVPSLASYTAISLGLLSCATYYR